MPNNNPRTPKRSWRGDQAASARSTKGQPSWKAEKPKTGISPRQSRIMRIVIALGLFVLVACTAVVIYLMWQTPEPFRLVLVDAAYEQNLSLESNAAGHGGMDSLATWAKGSKNPAIDVERGAFDDPAADPVAVGLTSNGLFKKSPDTVVVFLSGDGGGDAKGAYIWRNGAQPAGNRDGAYRISAALGDLGGKLPPATKKLLLLDATHNGANWSMGELHNDFVRALKADLQAAKVPNLVVLCSSDEGQLSLVSNEFGQSVFAHFVFEGLKGAADQPANSADDPCGDGNGDGRVSAWELARYVQCQVERWARRNRDMAQKPLLLGVEKTDKDAIESVAKDIDLVQGVGAYTAPALPETAWSPPAALSEAWKDREQLADGSPPPAAYMPQQWREYEAALLRYEQLLRAGSASAATTLQRVKLLHDQIADARQLNHPSMTANLAAPAALGWALPEGAARQLKEDFDNAWLNKAAKPERFTDLLAPGDDVKGDDQRTARRRLLSIGVIGLLLDKVAPVRDSGAASVDKEQWRKDYARVCELLPILADLSPAEANFAVMAHKSELRLPAGEVASWDLLRRALRTRRIAEAAALGSVVSKPKPGSPEEDVDRQLRAAYSEQVQPWIKAVVDDADVNRRLGEDLLFASPKEQNQAAKAFTDAESAGKSNYQKAGDCARQVRWAIETRNHALADLPWLTQWLARRPLAGSDEDKLKELWANVHDLCLLLETPDYGRALPLNEKTTAVKVGLEELNDRFERACKAMESAQILQDDLNQLEDLLTVPLINSERRSTLLKKAGAIALALNQGAQKTPTAAQSGPDAAKRLACQQGRLAAAVLGKPSEKDNVLGKASADSQTIENLSRGDRDEWQHDLDDAGDYVGRAFTDLAADAAKGAEAGRKAPPKQAGELLAQAALRTRFLDAGEADAFLGTVDPVTENRHVQMHDLLLWEAERTRLDFWASGAPDKPEPYYRTMGLLYTSFAKDLVSGANGHLQPDEQEKRLSEATLAEARLNAPDAVAFRWLDAGEWKAASATVHVTDEKTFELRYGLAGPKGAPAGRPVIWAKAGPKLKAPAGADQPHALDNLSAQPDDNSLPYTLEPDRPADPPPQVAARLKEVDKSEFVVSGLFRGRALMGEDQKPDMKTTVLLHNRPDLVSYQPAPEKAARIAVQAAAADLKAFASQSGELVIVLDYSGSMNDPYDPNEPKGDKRIKKALDALDECLTDLPDGVNLCVMAFSVDNDDKPEKDPHKIVLPRPLSPWDGKNEKEPLMRELRNKWRPYGTTPLVKSTVQALDKFDPKFKGAKAIIVLTDGGDSEFERDEPAAKRKKDMSTVLHEQFDHTGVQVHAVTFQATNLEGVEKVGYDAYKAAVTDIGGTFEDTTKVEALKKKLLEYFLRVRFRVEYENGDPLDPTDQQGKIVSRLNENLGYINVPKAAAYHVWIEAFQHQARKDLPEQRVRVEPGEVLVLDLKATPATESGFELRRDLWAQSNQIVSNNPPVVGPLTASKDWLFSVLSNKHVENDGTREAREITLSLESKDDHAAKGTVRQARPTWTWFAVKTNAADPKPASGLRFYPLPNFPAPVYRLDLAELASPTPFVDAWFWLPADGSDDLPASVGETVSQGPAKNQFLTPTDLKGRPVEVRPLETDELTHVVVESVTWETRTVEVERGKERRPVECLVVRLRYPEGRPYFAQLPPEVRWAGYEHKFYTEANKYTGVFFDVDKPAFDHLAWLKVISVEKVKSLAVQQGMHQGPVLIPGPGRPPDPVK